MSYRAVGENVYQFGPAAGSSPGIQLEMIVTVPGLSGLRNAYVSVLSADGTSAINGASRWLEACAAGVELRDASAARSAAEAAAARRTNASLRIVSVLLSDGRVGVCGWSVGRRVGAGSPGARDRFGPNHQARLGEPGTMRETLRPVARTSAHLSDEAVVALVARSDQDALAELYDRFGRVAYGLAFRILRDRALAEDAVQEGFMTAWRRADTFMPERAKASTWLLTLVHRRAVDLVRREERRR